MSASTPPTPPTPRTSAPPLTAATNPAIGEPRKGNPFKDTLNLPQTTFGMKADLVKNEPASVQRWNALDGIGLYAKLRELGEGRPRFVLHDGPPYANGSIHLGHLMNKCLKDFVVRARTMAGFDVPFVPGWDCHGLPIEHKVMTELAEKKELAKLQAMPEGERKMSVRTACQAYATKYVELHKQQMTRLLTNADYAHPYLTMTPSFEGATLEVLAGLMDQSLVYRALKPVHWSIDNQTALAEAELEYYDRQDMSVYVDFEAADKDAVYRAFGLVEPATDASDEVELNEPGKPVPGQLPDQTPTFMIWTTTPWTLPANVAIAVNPRLEYALVWVDGNVTVMAANQIEKVCQMARSEEVVVLARVNGDKLVGLRYKHPFVENALHEGAAFRVVAADYVTLDDGTGLVHTAPGHGTEDYQTGLACALPIYCPVRANGTYDVTVPEWLRGKFIWKANAEIVEHLRASGHLFHDHTFTHSYPHDWRSKTPVIFRCTEQWFVAIDGRGGKAGVDLRAMALRAVNLANPDAVRFVPEWGRNRMRGMLESRPDWCISRQRAWGLPIPAFMRVGPEGEPVAFMTAASIRAVALVVREHGADAWFTQTPAELLKHYNPATDPDPAGAALGAWPAALAGLSKGPDILDVWFESGSSWNSCMRQRGLGFPIDLYLEGSDQHRGWFQLSLLPALGVMGCAPYKTLLTHGFMVDKDGKKFSKSKGDSVEGLLAKYGADVLRWWVSSLAYENDVKADESYFDAAGESYRKVRNTLRFMLSNLFDFTPRVEGEVDGRQPNAGHCVDLAGLAPTSLDAWVLDQFNTLSRAATTAYQHYEFRAAHLALYDFANNTLSAVYCAAIKDRLYCDAPGSPRRRATQTVLFVLVDGLSRLLAPVLCHTADEVYRALWKVGEPGQSADPQTCVHLKRFIAHGLAAGQPSFGQPAFAVTADPAWTNVMALRERAMVAVEGAKKSLGVENPLDMGLTLPDDEGKLARFNPAELADLFNVSRITLGPASTAVTVADLRAEPLCERSRKRDATVRPRKLPASMGGGTANLCDRDAHAIGAV